MASLKAKRIIEAINKAIAVNPTIFQVKKVDKVLVEGSYEKVEGKVTYTGIIYLDDSSNSVIISSQKQGTSYGTERYKMVINNEVELTINEANKIEFDCKEGHIKVVYAYPIIIENTLCGYLCDLERS